MKLYMDPIQHVLNLLRQEIGETFDLRALTDEIAAWRGKRIVFEEVPLPIGITGFCIGLRDVDLICIRNDLNPERRLVTQLHELGHLALGHLPRFCKGRETPTYAQFQQERATWLSSASYRSYGEQYNQEQEIETEALATALLIPILRHQHQIPPTARDLYGGD